MTIAELLRIQRKSHGPARLQQNLNAFPLDQHFQQRRRRGIELPLHQPIHQVQQHVGMRLRETFVGATRRVKYALKSDSRQRPIEARPGLAGRDGEEVACPIEISKHFARAGKQGNLCFARKVVLAVACPELAVPIRRQFRRNQFHRVGKAEADHVACIYITWNG